MVKKLVGEDGFVPTFLNQYYRESWDYPLLSLKNLGKARETVDTIGEMGFEPMTSSSRTKHASQLRYSPLLLN